MKYNLNVTWIYIVIILLVLSKFIINLVSFINLSIVKIPYVIVVLLLIYFSLAHKGKIILNQLT
jgi:hypothetical protein